MTGQFPRLKQDEIFNTRKFPPLASNTDGCEHNNFESFCKDCSCNMSIDDDDFKELPPGASLNEFTWNPHTLRYDRKKLEQSESPWKPKKCECGITVLGYTEGHSDWCPMSPNYKEKK